MDNLPAGINQTNQNVVHTIDFCEDLAPTPNIQSHLYNNIHERAAILLANGNSVPGTAAQVGIAKRTLDYWLTNGHFCAVIESKKTELRDMLLGRINKASEKNWFAAAWILERNKVFGGEFKQQAAQSQGAAVNIQINVAHPGLVQVSQVQEQDSDLEK